MCSFRLSVLLLVMLVQIHSTLSKPFLESLICDYLCDDDDSTSTTTSSSTEDYDFFDICDCRPTTRRPNARRRGQNLPPINMRLPPSTNGMNFTVGNTDGIWSFNLANLPNAPPVPIGMSTPAPTTAAGATTAGGATTAAGTTAAGTTAGK